MDIESKYDITGYIETTCGGSDDTPQDITRQNDKMITHSGSGSPATLQDHPIKPLLPDTISECALTIATSGQVGCSSDEAVGVMREIVGAPNVSRAAVLEMVKRKLAVSDERSVLTSPEFMSRYGRERSLRELHKHFKVPGPTDVSLLTNFNIDQTLQQWTAADDKFFAYNFNMRDYENHGDTLHTVNMFDLYREGYRTTACVINSDYYAGRGKHWMALFVDCRDDSNWKVEFFNSSGNPPLGEFTNWMVKTKHQLTRAAAEHSLSPKIDIVRASVICHQKSSTECGVYSLYYIYARLNGTPWRYFAEHPIPDIVMFECRHHLFWDKKRTHVKTFKYDNYQKEVKILWEDR